jgi:hypothetical protein
MEGSINIYNAFQDKLGVLHPFIFLLFPGFAHSFPWCLTRKVPGARPKKQAGEARAIVSKLEPFQNKAILS